MLKPKQKKCIEMLVSGTMTQADVAAALKVSEQTICNWKRNDEFAAELEAANRLVISSLVPAAVQRTRALLSAARHRAALRNEIAAPTPRVKYLWTAAKDRRSKLKKSPLACARVKGGFYAINQASEIRTALTRAREGGYYAVNYKSLPLFTVKYQK